MKEELAIKVIKFLLTAEGETKELVQAIVDAGCVLEYENIELRKKLGIAEHTEVHLQSAEKALVEKDTEIQCLNKFLDIREKQLRAIQKENDSLKKKNYELIQDKNALETEKAQLLNSTNTAISERNRYHSAIRDVIGSFESAARKNYAMAENLKKVL